MKKRGKNNSQKILAVGPYALNNESQSLLRRYFSLKSDIKSFPTYNFYQFDPKLPYEKNFSIITIPNKQDNNVNSEKVAKDLVACSGLEIDGEPIIIMQIPSNQELDKNLFSGIDNVLEIIFGQDFNGTLNLSNFKKKFPGLLRSEYNEDAEGSFNEKGILDFVLFLCARHSMEISKDVRIIDFRNNDLRSLEAFVPAKKIFPALQTIFVEGNPISGNAFIFDEIYSSGVVLQQSMGGFVKQTHISFQQSPKETVEPPPPLIATNITDEQTIEIDPDRFITNPFLIEFLQQSAEDLSCILDFYTESSIMSITAETSSDLSPYQPFTRSLMHGRDNYAEGQEEIAELSLDVFGQTVIFNITKLQSCEVVEDGYLTVIHGYFEDERQVKIGFDRSLLIGQIDDNFFITNDQIHLRSVTTE